MLKNSGIAAGSMDSRRQTARHLNPVAVVKIMVMLVGSAV